MLAWVIKMKWAACETTAGLKKTGKIKPSWQLYVSILGEPEEKALAFQLF